MSKSTSTSPSRGPPTSVAGADGSALTRLKRWCLPPPPRIPKTHYIDKTHGNEFSRNSFRCKLRSAQSFRADHDDAVAFMLLARIMGHTSDRRPNRMFTRIQCPEPPTNKLKRGACEKSQKALQVNTPREVLQCKIDNCQDTVRPRGPQQCWLKAGMLRETCPSESPHRSPVTELAANNVHTVGSEGWGLHPFAAWTAASWGR